MDLPDSPATLPPGNDDRLPLPAFEPHSLRVWKGRAWELGLMLAAAGMLACLAL